MYIEKAAEMTFVPKISVHNDEEIDPCGQFNGQLFW